MPNWGDVLREIQTQQVQHMTAAQQLQAAGQQSIDSGRRKYLGELHAYAKRNIIAYYSGWLSQSPQIMNLGIVDEDRNGFMMACHGIDKSTPLDLILHTPGGSIAATGQSDGQSACNAG
jgi:ClpP class serine protease